MIPSILLVDDDPALTGLVRDAVVEAGWRFVSAGGAGEAERLLGSLRPDAVLLDVNLPDGTGFEVCANLRTIPGLQDLPVLFLTVRGDVESRLKAFASGAQDYLSKPFDIEELLARLRVHLQLKGRLDELAKRSEELAARERFRQDLVDMVVHDLRTPLGSLQITLGLLRESGSLSENDRSRLLKNAEGSAEFLVLMVNDLLDLRAGRLRVRPEPLDVAKLYERLSALLDAPAKRRGVSLKLEPPAAPVASVTDPVLVFRTLVNLLVNSIKFSKKGMRVTLAAVPEGGGLRFSVEDQGPGIPAAERERIFRKGFRGDTPAAKLVPGYGIGLAFCKLASEAMGGSIRYEEPTGGGSRFVVALPSLPAGVGTG